MTALKWMTGGATDWMRGTGGKAGLAQLTRKARQQYTSARFLQDKPAPVCHTDTDPDAWTETDDGPGGEKARAYAVDKCMDCPLIKGCLEYAVKTGQKGVWGGTTDAERKDKAYTAKLLKAYGIGESDEHRSAA